MHVHWKGAAEIVLASCSSWLDANGLVQTIDNEVKFIFPSLAKVTFKTIYEYFFHCRRAH